MKGKATVMPMRKQRAGSRGPVYARPRATATVSVSVSACVAVVAWAMAAWRAEAISPGNNACAMDGSCERSIQAELAASEAYNDGVAAFHGTGHAVIDKERGRGLILEAAEKGHPCAIGEAHHYGLWGDGGGYESVDSAKALGWFRKAFEDGMVCSYYWLGVFAAEGLGGEPMDEMRGVRMLKLAIERAESHGRGDGGRGALGSGSFDSGGESGETAEDEDEDEDEGSAQGSGFNNGLALASIRSLAQCELAYRYMTSPPPEAGGGEGAERGGRDPGREEHGDDLAAGGGLATSSEEAARALMQASADSGNALCQTRLGFAYANGLGLREDKEKAVEFYKRAAGQNYDEAQFFLAMAYMSGAGVGKDLEEGARWMHMAAANGYCRAAQQLGEFYTSVKSKKDEAHQWFVEAAEHGCSSSQVLLGIKHELGIDGFEQDAERAVYWYRRAAEQGDSDGELYLGLCYLYGTGVEASRRHAGKWVKRSAGKGNARGEFHYGALLSEHPNYYEKALGYWRRAMEKGSSDAMVAIGDHYMGVEGNSKKAYDHYLKAANDDDPNGQFKVGECLFKGKGVGKDLDKSIRWLKVARDKGHAEASELLEAVFHAMDAEY